MSFLRPQIFTRANGFLNLNLRNVLFNRALNHSPNSQNFFYNANDALRSNTDRLQLRAQQQANAGVASANSAAKQEALRSIQARETEINTALPGLNQEYTDVINAWAKGIKDKVSSNLQAAHPGHRRELAELAENTAQTQTRLKTDPTKTNTAIEEALDAWAAQSTALSADAMHDAVKVAFKAEDSVIPPEAADDIAKLVKARLEKGGPEARPESINLAVYQRLNKDTDAGFELGHTPADEAGKKVQAILDEAKQTEVRRRLEIATLAKNEIDTVIGGQNWAKLIEKDRALGAVHRDLQDLQGRRQGLDALYDGGTAEEVHGVQLNLIEQGKTGFRANPKATLFKFWHWLPQRQIKAGSEFLSGYMPHGNGRQLFKTAARGTSSASDYVEAQVPLLERFNTLLGRVRNSHGVNWNMHSNVPLKGGKTLTVEGLQHGEEMATVLEDPAIRPRMEALKKTTKSGTWSSYAEVVGRKKPDANDGLLIRSEHHSFFHPGGSPLSSNARIQIQEGATHQDKVAALTRGIKYAEGLAPAKRGQVSPQLRLQNGVATKRGEKIADTIEEAFADGKTTVDALAVHDKGRVSLKAKKGGWFSPGGKDSTRIRVRQDGDKKWYGAQKTRYVRLNTQGQSLAELEDSATQALGFAENAAKRNPNVSPNTMLSKAERSKGQVVQGGKERYNAFETAFEANKDAVANLETSGIHLRAIDANTIRVEAPHRWGFAGNILNPKHIFSRNASFNKVVRGSGDLNVGDANNLVEAAVREGNRRLKGKTKTTTNAYR